MNLGTETLWREESGSLWLDGGVWKLPGAYTREEAEAVVGRWDGTNWGPCSNCGRELRRNEVAQHFASRLCPECWEEYKDDHDETCRKCGNKRYNCHC